MHKKFTPILVCLTASLYAEAEQQVSDVAKHITTIIDAEPIKKSPPAYPISAVRKGYEGWVVVSYIVEPDGTTSNAVVEKSSGGKVFEKEALKAIKKWRYTPAYENGKAIQQCHNSVQLDFKISGTENSVRKRFNNWYRLAQKSLKDNDLNKAQEIINRLNDMTLATHAEHRFLNYINLDFATATNDTELEYESLNNILKFTDFFNYKRKLKEEENVNDVRSIEDEKLYSSVLTRKLVIELSQNKVNQALDSVDDLLLLRHDSEVQGRYKQQRQKIIDFIESNKVLVTDASIETRDFWQYRLVRNNFSFDQIDGQLHKLDIRCNNKRHVYTINDQSTWKIPKSWQKCQLFVYGDNNTTFKLIEHGNQKTTDEQVGH